MIWLIVLFIGGSLIGGLMAFLASDSKTSSKDNDVDIDTTNSQGIQTEQGISRVPERSLWLNTTPAMAPTQPAMAPMIPQPQPKGTFDIPDEKKDIKNTQELNSLTSLWKNKEKVRQLEEDNKKLEKEVTDIKLDELNFISALKQSRERGADNVYEDLITLLEAVQELKNLPEANKEAIIDKITNIQKPAAGAVNLVYDGGNPSNNLAKCITDLKTQATESTALNDTKKQRLIDAMKIILDKDASEKETIDALEDILIQLSRSNNNNRQVVANSQIQYAGDNDDTTLKGVFRGFIGDLRNKVNGFCLKLKNIDDVIRKRTIDDKGFSYANGVTIPGADHFKPLRLTGQFLHASNTFGHVANAISPATGHPVIVASPVGNPNNKEFKNILDKVNKHNKKVRSFKEISKFYDDENRDKIQVNIVELNRKLFGQFTLLNETADTAVKDNITNDIKGIIITILNNASNVKPNEGESDRRQIYNYLTKIGFKINLPSSGEATKDCSTFKVGDIQGIDSAILKDKDTLKKVSEYCDKKLKIKKNKEDIAQLQRNMISL